MHGRGGINLEGTSFGGGVKVQSKEKMGESILFAWRVVNNLGERGSGG